MPTSSVHVFNQYYWDLLKKVKDLAKDLKTRADDKGSRNILREIKRSYLSFDKLSDEHIAWYNQKAAAFESFIATNISEDTPVESVKGWVNDNDVLSVELYKGITIGNIAGIFRNTNVVLYYIVLMSVFADGKLKEDETYLHGALDLLKKTQPWSDEDLAADNLSSDTRKKMLLLRDILRVSSSNTPSSPSEESSSDIMSELENTSLGRLAKEIMNDVDIDEISKSIGEDGDILKALGNPDGGITKLLGTVSQKMISKLASGELKQDALLQDAMKLAGALPGMSGGKGGAAQNNAMGGLGNMASMMEQVTKMASMFGPMGGKGNDDDDGDGPDLASMMSQFANMMGNGGGKNKGGTRTTVNHSALNRAVRSKQMRRKLEERRRKHEEQ